MGNNIETQLIKNIKDTLSKNKWSKNDIGQFLTDVRNLIEYKKLQKELDVLYFFCNWASHPNIDRNKELYNILEKISLNFQKINITDSIENRKFNSYPEIIIDAINIRKLASDIISLLINSKIIITSIHIRMNDLIIIIFQNLLQKKIHFPDMKKTDKKKEEIIRKSKDISEFINNNEKYNNSKLDNRVDYSLPVIIRSLKIEDVNNRKIDIEMEIMEELIGKKVSGGIKIIASINIR